MNESQSSKTLHIGPITSLIILAVVTFAVFSNSLFGEFVYDDVPFIDSYYIRSIRNIPVFFMKGVWDLADMAVKDSFLYRPLFTSYLAIIYGIDGANPLIYHLANILLHLGNSTLVFFFIRKIFKDIQDTPYPLLGALLFSVHPVHVESVSWISGATDSLMTIFFLSSMLCYMKSHDNSSNGYRFLSFIFFVCSLCSKEVAITLPVIFVAYDYLLRRKIYLKNLLLLLAVSVAFMIVRSIVLGKAMGVLNISSSGITSVFEFIGGYIKLLLLPWPIGLYREPPHFGWDVILLSSFAMALMAYVMWKERSFIFPAVWIFVTLSPSLSLAFYSTPTFAVRYLYLPSVGCSAILAALFRRYGGENQRFAYFIVLFICVIFGSISAAESRNWRNDEVFYSRMIRETPGFAGGYFGLARYYERQGFYDKAINEYENALDYSKNKKDKAAAYDSLGYLHNIKGDMDKSIIYYEKELGIDPKSSSALLGIGNNYMMKSDVTAAVDHYEKAFAIDGKNYEACYNLAMLYERMGRTEKAVYYYGLFVGGAPQHIYGETIGIVRKKLDELKRLKP